MEGFDEVIEEFLVESYESLDQLDSDLLALEDTPEDRDRLASIFRTVHTIKGTSGFLAFPTLERVAHVGENLLVPLRDGEFELTRDMADSLLEMVDAIRNILGAIESNGCEGDANFEALVAKLEALKSQKPGSESTNQDDDPGDSIADSEDNQDEEEVPATVNESPEVSGEAEPETRPVQSAASETPIENEPAKSLNPTTGEGQCAADTSGTESSDRTASVADSTVRINVELLDKLMNLVGELVLSRNQILQFSENTEDASMIAASQRLNLITTELQEGVMKTRMQPIRNAWNKLPRVVRDLSSSCGKQVEVRMEGADTELDKTILEALKDPLTHIVRNSVDHGIETSEERVANGKPGQGELCLRAFHEGGQVNIEIADDGAGINTDRVRAKAIEKGLVTEEQAERMGERELTNLILLPGFSTAPKVTNVSGRGVGMDVVKTNIERIGGTIDISSVQGQGTTLRIKIPLTLAIVPALIVKSHGDNYAIPQVSLLELLRLDRDRAGEQIEFIHDTPVYRLRGNLLPLVYLDEQLMLSHKRSQNELPDSVNIVVLQVEDHPFGLVVDTITDTQEIVVKPLGRHLKNITAYAGTTIMGDGTVALILDVVGLAHMSSVLTEHGERSIGRGHMEFQDQNREGHSLLVVDPGDGTRAAVMLSTVARLEEIEAATVERSGCNDVVQYRGQIMPLIYLNGSGIYGDEEGQLLNTVVFAHEDKNVGVVVGKIMDIVHETLPLENGELPSRCIINDRVTEMIDLTETVQNNFPELFLNPQAV